MGAVALQPPVDLAVIVLRYGVSRLATAVDEPCIFHSRENRMVDREYALYLGIDRHLHRHLLLVLQPTRNVWRAITVTRKPDANAFRLIAEHPFGSELVCTTSGNSHLLLVL